MEDKITKTTTKKGQGIKLNALLEVTKAINNNFSTSQLIALYQQILEYRLGIGKLILLSFETELKCILKYGLKSEFIPSDFEKELLQINEIKTIGFTDSELSKNFEIIIPVFHKEIPLAFVLLGDVDQQKIGQSAAVKHLPFIQTLTNIIIVAIENKKLHKENIQREKIKKELELAQSMQQMLFPQDLPNTEALMVSAAYLPHQQVGGDYYDFVKLNNHEYIFCIADVSGKGVAAALLMSNIHATLHSLINYTHNLKDIVIELNKRVVVNTKSEKFVSLFLAKLNTKSQQLTYINAGHNPPILYYESKFFDLIKGCSLLGIRENLLEIEVEIFNYNSEFTLLCYTDGITDAQNLNNESISTNDLKEFLINNKNLRPNELNAKLLLHANEFKQNNEFQDDIALLTLKVSDLYF